MDNESTIQNLQRKSLFVDDVQYHESYPLFSWIEISLTELCNRKCEFCPRVDGSYPNQNLHMSIDLIDKIGHELRNINFKGAIGLCGYGEPMLHDNIYEVLRRLHGVDVEIVTNGDQLTSRVIKDLYDSGLSHLQISMYDGPHQIDIFESMLREAGINDANYSLKDRWYDENSDYGLCLTNRAGVMNLGPKEVELNKPCNYIAYSLMIDWNGDVLLCSQDWHKKRKFGNLTTISLVDAWLSSPMKKYRDRLIFGNRSSHPCNLCNVGGTKLGSNHVVEWKRNQ